MILLAVKPAIGMPEGNDPYYSSLMRSVAQLPPYYLSLMHSVAQLPLSPAPLAPDAVLAPYCDPVPGYAVSAPSPTLGAIPSVPSTVVPRVLSPLVVSAVHLEASVVLLVPISPDVPVLLAEPEVVAAPAPVVLPVPISADVPVPLAAPEAVAAPAPPLPAKDAVPRRCDAVPPPVPFPRARLVYDVLPVPSPLARIGCVFPPAPVLPQGVSALPPHDAVVVPAPRPHALAAAAVAPSPRLATSLPSLPSLLSPLGRVFETPIPALAVPVRALRDFSIRHRALLVILVVAVPVPTEPG
mmetsp:Transcript_8411/g.18848  ORF Transcript_8411/g.18848 Transcript_8411/m.18848 type:complete len:298 (+) Transcript_8411:1839-2732(+)